MELLLSIGAIAAFNLIILKMKVDAKRYADAFIDLTAFILFISFSGGTLGGIVIATVASLIVSIFLFASPPKFTRST